MRACRCVAGVPEPEEGEPPPEAVLRRELKQLSVKQLKARALGAGASPQELEDAEEADDYAGALVALVVANKRIGIDTATQDALRAELARMHIKGLKQRAQAEGISPQQVADAEDKDDFKGALIQLIVQALAGSEPSREDIRAELHALKVKPLKQRAIASGVTDEELDSAEEANDYREAIIELILKRECSAAAPSGASEALRAELSGVRLVDLFKRAEAAGVSDARLDAAEHQEDIRGALIEMIIATEREAGGSEAQVALALRAELSGESLRTLMERAVDAGVKIQQLDEAEETENHRSALIDLIVSNTLRAGVRELQAHEPQPQPDTKEQTEQLKKQSEHPMFRALESHQLEEYFERLLEMGLKRVEDLGQLTQVDLSQTLQMKRFDLAKFTSAFLTEKPHHGMVAAKGTTAKNAGGFCFENGKHCMFSYQWDDQDKVVHVREEFEKLGATTWMDIDGGMKVNIYDSMASGVGNAAVVIAFISQRYQDSDNCKLELTLAKQNKVPIVPVKMQGNGWSATEWLGAVTAGLLYTPMYDPSTMQQNMQGLVGQVKAALPKKELGDSPMSTHAVVTAGSGNESEQMLSLRSELDSLRKDLARSMNQRAPTEGPSNSDMLAPIPAEVPQLSLNVKPTPDMKKLKRMLISPASDDRTMAVTSESRQLSRLDSKVGALGMGGIGKTVTASWLARDEDVRRYFELVVWVTLGQTPELARTLRLIYMQLTGNELAAESSSEQVKEMVTVAMRGRLVLLILDDVWEEAHEQALNFVDTSTASKTLVTTRIRGLAGGMEVALGMPSEDDAVQILLAAAGLEHLSPPPPEAAEVVSLCGRLPLAVDLAGKMLRDWGVGEENWAGIPRLLREEMRGSRDDGENAVEYRVIAASLNSIPVRERADAKKVFSCFALVAEDTHVPIAALCILLSAVTGQSELVPELQLRRWLQVLINRSLVLGSWERPQLHDIVRDYTISLFSDLELRQLQTKTVDAFAAARPADPIPTLPSLRRWPRSADAGDGDECAAYVRREIEYHIVAGLDLSMEELPPCVEAWLCHISPPSFLSFGSTDCIVNSAFRVLGEARLLSIGRAAVAAGNDRLAFCALMWGCAGERYRTEGFNFMLRYSEIKEEVGDFCYELAWPSMRRWAFEGHTPEHVTAEENAWWTLSTCLNYHWWACFLGENHMQQLLPFVTAADIAGFRSRASEVLESTAVGGNHDMDVAQLNAEVAMSRLKFAGDVDSLHAMQLKQAIVKTQRTLEKMNLKSLVHTGHLWYSACNLSYMEQWDWQLVDQVDILSLFQTFSFDSWDHSHQIVYAIPPDIAVIPALRGDIGAAHGCFDIITDYCRRVISSLRAAQNGPDATFFKINMFDLMGLTSGLWALRLLGRCEDAAAIMDGFGTTWSTADARVDAHQPTEAPMRKRGSTERVALHISCAEQYSWNIKLNYVMCTARREVPTAEVVADLPSPDILDTYATTVGVKRVRSDSDQHDSMQLLAAAVCEKLGRPADALLYVAKALRTDPDDPYVDRKASTRAEGHTIRGRMLAHQGKVVEAEEAFEEAIAVSHRTGLRLFEMLALRDLTKCVLEPDGRREDGIRRLKGVLREMKGPTVELTKLLGQGFDAQEILRS